MPVLPLIDALILLGWSSLLAGFLLKTVYVTTAYRPTFFGLHPMDFLMVAAVCLLFAMALAARTWVKAREPEILAQRRRRRAEAAYEERMGSFAGNGGTADGEKSPQQEAQPRRAAGL